MTDILLMRRNMPCSLVGPVTSWENIDSGRLLCGVPHHKQLKLLKEKVN